jgi:hypothetical protein
LPPAWNVPVGRAANVAKTAPLFAFAPTVAASCILSALGHGRVLPNCGLVRVTAAEGCPTGVTTTVASYIFAGLSPSTCTAVDGVGPTPWVPTE